MYRYMHTQNYCDRNCCCCLPTPLTLASGGESHLPAFGSPNSFSVHLPSSAVTLAGSVHKSRGDNVVPMWVQCECYKVGIVVVDMICVDDV